MGGNFVPGNDSSLRTSEAEQRRRALRLRHKDAYFLGGLWHCPHCKKTGKTAESLTKKLCN